ncbi:hypothetical protein IAR55_004266 [Kwoniella newhampshirensis]|uniref:Uncharacterized protein n=1 Tax=Kwoniella newhampshirensis TaxID=1651941 RepID=A0AAW0YMZ6_9TREE
MPTTVPSPSSTISAADTILPTPDQPYSSRRSSLYSLHMSEKRNPEMDDGEEEDLFSPSTSRPYRSNSALTFGPPLDESAETPTATGSIPSISVHNHPDSGRSNGRSTSPTPLSRQRRGTGSSMRAPPPPPIFLRRATERGNDEVEAVPVPSSASSSSTNGNPGSAKGLNISGMRILPSTGIIEHSEDGPSGEREEADALPELLSPRRLVFTNSEGAPSSPAWQSFEGPSSAGLNPSSSWGRRTSLDVPSPLTPSPLGARNNERRFEPTPTHGLHARNLSLYFPQPGAVPQPRAGSSVPGSPMGLNGMQQGQEIMIPNAGADRKTFGGAGNWTFGQAQATGLEGTELQTPEGVKRSKRRGHHHKHSLSHNFFSFLDPTQTNPTLAIPASPSPGLELAPAPGPEATPAPVPMPLLGSSSHMPSSPTLSPLPPSSKVDPHGQFLLSFAVLEFLIGAGLWIEGQMSGWRCLAGVGYLVVFDAIGVAVGMIGRKEGQGWSSIRRPYGPSRFVSLLYFAQSLFLAFAAVYIAKESIEQVILGSGAHEHAVGGHGHGEALSEGDERSFPHFLLLCAGVASAFSGGALGNHSKLVDAAGSIFLNPSYLSLPVVSRYPALFANPFSLTVTGASIGILVSTLVVPPASLHSLDALISLNLTILTTALSYPSTVAFAHILLQTAPPPSQTQMTNLRKALKEVKEDRRVIGLGTMRCWAVTAGKGHYEHHRTPTTPTGSQPGSSISSPVGERFSFSFSPSASPSRKSSTNGEYTIQPSSYPSPFGYPSGQGNGWTKDPSSSSSNGLLPLVVTLTVHVQEDVGDRDILDVTRMTWGKVNQAINGGGLGRLGKNGEGEVSIYVKRGWDGMEDG